MRTSHRYFAAMLMLLFCPAIAHANATPVSDTLANQCRQLESAHGPTREFPNTYYANLVFQCATNPGTAPAGMVMKEIEQYGKGLARSDSGARSDCQITMANGGLNVLSQGPMQPFEPSAANDVVVSYNAKYACFTPKHAARYAPATRYEQADYKRAYDDQPLYAMQPQTGYAQEETIREEVSYTPPRAAWIARDEAHNNRRHYRATKPRMHKATYRYVKPSVKKTVSRSSKKNDTVKVKVDVKVTPAPAPVQAMPSGPAPTSPLPGFHSP
jgi:hypothetical protein